MFVVVDCINNLYFRGQNINKFFEKKKIRYFYRLLSGPEPLSTFEQNRAWHVPEQLDLVAMQVN